MGVKDHLKDGTGHILSLGLDLDYLQVDGADQQASLNTRKGAGSHTRVREPRAAALDHSRSTTGSGCASLSPHLSSSSSSSCCSNFSEESAVSDSDEEHLPGSEPLKEPSSVRQTVGQDLDLQNTSPGVDPQEQTLTLADTATVCRTKVDFALKLGYSEELVLQVLRKLGPHALINDILGELVKLGTKTDSEHQGAANPSQFSFSSLTSSSSSSSLDSCHLLCPSLLQQDKENLRPVVVDGSNVAMSHGNKEAFSCQGIQLAVDWFLERGHHDITVFVPAWRKEQSRPDALITDQEILRRLEKDKILVFTPSRRVQGRRVVCYDDRFIVKLAYESDGIIVSNDNYRDLANEKPEWKKFIDERLLMYSFVNDKFMPPDDPLGRHGPSLENFLRKRPVIPEHRKQPCPYGKKCTYGHKCKFYHPERGSQPQRAVADELRASAKSSSVASKGQLEDALIVRSQSSGQIEAMNDTGQFWDIPKKQPPSRTQSTVTDLLDDSFPIQSKLEGRRGSSSSSSSSCSSIVVHSAPVGPPSTRSDRWDYQGGCSTKVTGAIVPSLTETCHRCESPDQGYSSLVKAYSSLSLVVPQSPESFFPTGSLLSDCSSEGSASSDSFSPDPLLDDGPKCHYHHRHHLPPYHHLHHHQCSGQPTRPASHVPPRTSQHAPFTSTPQALWKQNGFSLDDHLSPANSYAAPRVFKPPSVHIPPQPQHPFLNTFPEEFQNYSPLPPQTSMAPSQSPSTSNGQNTMGSLWQDIRFQHSPVYKGSPVNSRRTCELNQQAQNHVRWETSYQQSPKPCYDLFAIKSVPEIQDWPSPLERHAHLSPRGLSGLSFPSLRQVSLPPIPTHKGYLPQRQEPPALGRYQDLREKVFANLCRIFSPELVKVVMTKNPHIIDAQELAAAILVEKSQQSS